MLRLWVSGRLPGTIQSPWVKEAAEMASDKRCTAAWKGNCGVSSRERDGQETLTPPPNTYYLGY